MFHKPQRPPQSDLERAAQDLASGKDARSSVRTLAQQAGLTDANVDAAETDPSQGVGTLDGRVVVLALPKGDVKRLLPMGLELAPQPLTFPDKHPVFVMFNHDHFEAWFGDMDYNEVMIGVPYVQRCAPHVAHRGPFVYMPRLYLDATAPKVLGNLLYGFEKQMGDIENGERTYSVRAPADGTLVAHATFSAAGPEGPPSATPNFHEVRRIFDMPTISQALRIVDEDAFEEDDFVSPFLGCTITYDLSDAHAKIQPLTATVEFTDALTPAGLPTGPIDVPSLDTEILGAFRMKVNQVVSLPTACDTVTYQTPSPPPKRRVAVLGGGPAALATAYYLARQVDRYEVELFTLGWRLGGKCAAGRNEDYGNRIEEHGLHAFVGFYENAFRTMRDVYADAGLPIAVGTPPYDYAAGEGPVAGGFVGCPDVGVFDRFNDQWRYFATPQAFNGEVPGEIPEGGEDPKPNLCTAVCGALRQIAQDTGRLLGVEHTNRVAALEAEKEEQGFWASLVEDVKDFVDVETRGVREALEDLVEYVERLAIDAVAREIQCGSMLFKGIAVLLKFIRGALKKILSEELEEDPEVFFIWQGLDVVLTAMIGLIESCTVDFDTLDDYDLREWLLANGLDPRNRDAAAFTQVYETLFAHGDELTPDRLAAGVGLRWFVLVGFLYKGYPAYFFKYSCPQTMCTPYYAALRKFGAKVHFFHQVTDLQVEGSGRSRRLAGVTMQVQATVKDGGTYDPFVHVEGNPPEQPAWPDRPNFDQLEQGDALREGNINLENPWSGWEGVDTKELLAGRDFDDCVLGIPISVFPKIATQLTDTTKPQSAPAWARMVSGMSVVRTISTQLWFQQPLSALSKNSYGMLTSFAQPEPSLGNFTHLLAWEPCTTDDGAKSLAYHTGCLRSISIEEGYPDTDAGYPAREQTRWRDMFGGWLREHFEGMYDSVVNYDVLLDSLAVKTPAAGEDRLAQQYFNISTHPSDHYVLAQPKAIGLRLGQSESWVKGLFLCGDWTRTDLNCGCVEASTQSGMLAARAISNHPRYVWHPGF